MKIAIKKLLTIFLIFFLFINALGAQEQKQETIRYLVDQDGKLFWNKKLPAYIRIASNPSDSGILMRSEVTKAYTNPYYFDTEGKNKIRSRWATDQQTRKAIVPETEVIWEVYVDGIAPVSNLIFANSKSFSVKGKPVFGKLVSLEIKSNDENSGIESVYYSLNSEDYKPYTSPFQIDNEGDHLIKYYAVDKVGNVEIAREKSFITDFNPPKTYYTITGISDGEIIAISTKIYLSSEDSITGSSKTFYKIDNEPEKLNIKGTYIPIKHLKDGEHKLYFYSIDNVGNKENENVVPFYLDLTAPIVASDILGDRYVLGDKIFFSGRTKMKLTAVDNMAGVQDILYSVDEGEFIKYDQPFYLPNVTGTHIVKYFATDKMQNNSDAGTSKYEKYKHVVNRIYIDLTGPILSHTLNGPTFKARDTLFISNKTLIKFMAKDDESGVQFVTYSLDQDPDEKTYTEPMHIDAEGYHQIVYYGYDNVKNRNRAEIFVYIDGRGPEIKFNFSIVAQGNKDGFPVYPQHVTIYLGATDQIIGAKEIFYSLNNGSEKKYSLSINGFTKNSMNTLNIRALDLLGNETILEIKFYVE